MLYIEKKIEELSYSNYSSVSKILDQLWGMAETASKFKNNLDADVIAILHRWILSINNKRLYSQLPTSHKDYGIEQLRMININRAKTNIGDLLRRIEKLMKVKLQTKDKKNGSNSSGKT